MGWGRRLGWAVLLAIVVSAGSWENPFVLDDITKIVENPDLRQLRTLPEKLVYPYHTYQILQRNDPSRPVVYVLYGLSYAAAGLTPLAYRFWNILFHALAIFFLSLLMESWWAEKDRAWAWFATALFACAPMQMGTVIYIYGLSDVLSGAALLVALYAFCHQEKLSWKSWGVGAFSYLLALGCKQSAVILPALVFLVDRFHLRVWRPRLYVAGVLSVGLYLLWRFTYFGGVGDLESYAQAHPRGVYLLAQGWVLWQYVWRAWIPWHLAIDHYLMPHTLGLESQIAAWMAWGLVWTLLLWKWRQHREQAFWSFLVFGLAWFWICLLPVSSFFPTVDFMVERRVYLANAGLYFVGCLLLQRWGHSFSRRHFFKVAGALYLGFLCTVTWARNRIFSSAETLWKDVLEVYPGSQRSLNSLSTLYIAQGRYEEAVEIFERTLKLYPTDFLALGNYGSLMASEDYPQHNLEKALGYFQRSAQVRPDVGETDYNIGRILQMMNRHAEAEPYYRRALQLKPNYVPALNNLGAVCLQMRRLGEAEGYLRRAQQLDPTYVPAQKNWELLLLLKSQAGHSGGKK